MIKKGQPIKFKRQYQDAGDEKMIFVAAEDQDGDRVLVACTNSLTNFASTQVVRVDQIMAKVKRDEDNARYIERGEYSITPMSGGYWAISRDGGLIAAWITAQDVRDYFNRKEAIRQ